MENSLKSLKIARAKKWKENQDRAISELPDILKDPMRRNIGLWVAPPVVAPASGTIDFDSLLKSGYGGN